MIDVNRGGVPKLFGARRSGDVDSFRSRESRPHPPTQTQTTLGLWEAASLSYEASRETRSRQRKSSGSLLSFVPSLICFTLLDSHLLSIRVLARMGKHAVLEPDWYTQPRPHPR